MATIFIMAGSLFGFASAIGSVLLLDVSLLMGFAIWMIVGLLSVGIAISAAMNPPRPVNVHSLSDHGRHVA